MKINVEKMSLQIKDIKTIDLANIANVGRNMAEKYKNFSHFPSLQRAVLIEDAFSIPARSWVDIKKFKDTQK